VTVFLAAVLALPLTDFFAALFVPLVAAGFFAVVFGQTALLSLALWYALIFWVQVLL
jgi:hypothetical protein